MATGGRLKALYDFENRKVFFPDVHASFKFCVFVASPSPINQPAQCAVYLHSVTELDDPERRFPLRAADFARVNPNTGTAPAFRTRRELEEREGAYPVGGNRFRSPTGDWVPLYEGKIVQAFDHRAASVVVNPENQHRPGQPRAATCEQHRDPNWVPNPQFWVLASECGWSPAVGWVLGFKEITATTNIRTFIAAFLPTVAFGNKIPLLKLEAEQRCEWLLAANLNATVFDFVAPQKVQGQTLNLFIIEQLPVVPPQRYEAIRFGRKTTGAIVREAVFELTYAAHDMTPFARDIGYVDDIGRVRPPTLG